MAEDNKHPVAEPEVHLLPHGFIGQVTIHHGRADGAPATREGDARLYRIPADGVLATQAAANYGIRPPERMQYYWTSAAGERTALPVRPTAEPGVLAFYQVGPDAFYVVDRPENAGQYRNPALRESPPRG
jgi:hypothetical protein